MKTFKHFFILAASLFAISCSKNNGNDNNGGGNSGGQPYVVDETFASPDITTGLSIGARQADGKVIAATSSGAGMLTRYNLNGAVDASFKPPAAITSGKVSAIAAQPDGKTLVAGTFTVGSNVNLARLNVDGSLDNTFRLTGLSTATPSISAILVQSDGRIIIGGLFDRLQSGTTVSGIARLSASGAVDPGFAGLKFNSFTARVSHLLLLSDGKIMISGDFSIGAGTALRRTVVRLNTDGSPDLGFNYTTRLWTSNIPQIPGFIFVLKADNSGRLLIGGDFNRRNGNADGSSGTVACNGVLQLNMDGSEVAGFASPAKGRGAVRSILPVGTDKILVGRLTDLNALTNLLEYVTLLTSAGADAGLELKDFKTGDAWELLPGPDNTVYMIGSFTKGQNSYKNVVRLKPQ